MDRQLLGTYANGNTIVQLYSDGTKIRYIPDNEYPMPVRPESIDLKITDRCYGVDGHLCEFCHEKSAPTGKHGDLIHRVLDDIRPGTELAIGGGNPLSHPDLEPFLVHMRDRGVICNMTLNWKHFDGHYDAVVYYIRHDLIHGVGISVNELIPGGVMTELMCWPNIVVHTIAGIASPEVYKNLYNRDLNLLILGYKTYGRGATFRSEHDISHPFNWLKDNVLDMAPHFRTVCFDNLAVEQLDMKSRLSTEVWNKFYMGDDGAFTMYIDLVNEEFARSSVSVRHPIGDMRLNEMFRVVRSERSGSK